MKHKFLGRKPLESRFDPMKKLFVQYRRGARERNIEFSLTKEQVFEISQKTCFYCGEEPSNSLKRVAKIREEFFYNGLDRVDPNKGYIISNIVPSCKLCNFAKSTLTQKRFYNWIVKVYEYNKKNNRFTGE